MLRHAGYFRELPGGFRSGPSIEDARGKLPGGLVGSVAAYLNGGTILSVSPAPASDDWFTGARQVTRLGSLTDGEWTWPMSLAYYVEQYRVGIPQEFLAHMQQHGWQCPPVPEDELGRIIDEIEGS